MIDAFTTTDRYPYAQDGDRGQLDSNSGLNHTFNYVRNSVKVTVNAYDGAVTFYDVSGGALWVGSLTVAGYLFGNIPWVKENLDKIIWGAILIPGALVFIGAWRARKFAL